MNEWTNKWKNEWISEQMKYLWHRVFDSAYLFPGTSQNNSKTPIPCIKTFRCNPFNQEKHSDCVRCSWCNSSWAGRKAQNPNGAQFNAPSTSTTKGGEPPPVLSHQRNNVPCNQESMGPFGEQCILSLVGQIHHFFGPNLLQGHAHPPDLLSIEFSPLIIHFFNHAYYPTMCGTPHLGRDKGAGGSCAKPWKGEPMLNACPNMPQAIRRERYGQ